MTTLAPGHVTGDRFKLIRRLGEGGMGEVWLVEDLELSDRVVAKMVPRGATEDQLTLLRRECRHARKLVHANIVPVYDFHRASGAYFITMAYVEGVDIGSLRGRPIEHILPPLIAVAGALVYAHARGIVHRDLKVSNVLIDETGEPQLLDFGISGLVAHEGSVDGIIIRGGGSEGSASPQQLAGASPSVTDDIYAFGVLARDLLSGQKLPPKLDGLLNAAMNREARHRPQTMSEVKSALETIQSALNPPPVKDVKLTPPPRVSRVDPIVPVEVGAREAPPVNAVPSVRSEHDVSRGGVGSKTIAVFVVLFALVAGVFIVLPRWVEESASPVTGEQAEKAEKVAAPLPPSEETGEDLDLEDLAQEMAEAENVLARAVALRESLDARNAGVWGGDAYRDALKALTRGEEQMGRRAFADAEASFQSALSDLDSVRASSNTIAADAIRRGREALAAGSSTEAEDAFALALQIQPSSAEAKRGFQRAKVLDEVQNLVARGEELERRGKLDGAADSYRKAVALDALARAAQQGLARIDSKASEEAFTRAMSEAVAALKRSDFDAARSGFERARAIKPEAPDVADGLEAVKEGERVQAIAEHREKATTFETQEAWRSAEQQYQAVLDMDDTIRFAQEGKARALVRAELSEKLEFHIGHRERLSEDKVLEEASTLLENARAESNLGPKLEGQIARLADLVAEFSTPVQVRFLSDGKTEVVVYKIGSIGKFESHALVLRPGTYTVVGRCRGYRDVRYRLVVRADAPPEPLDVRCEEKI
ncbi:MAG: hypothetical protein BMS9Abin37_1184 [Acidobacteriota bacterium]|nr:MAG: hypothetical protein BMS9Abin37_1184 [Acidobacteriota bacterium]